MYYEPTFTKKIIPYHIFKCERKTSKIYDAYIPKQTSFSRNRYSVLLDRTKNIWDLPYFYGNLTTSEAEIIIKAQKEHSFLLRLSNSREHLLAVTFKVDNIVIHFLIEEYLLITNHSAETCDKNKSLVLEFGESLNNHVNRINCFTLKQLSRSVILSYVAYSSIDQLEIPNILKKYLKNVIVP